MISAKNSLMIKGGFAPNQLVFGRKLSIPSITGELTLVSTERRRKLLKECTGRYKNGKKNTHPTGE